MKKFLVILISLFLFSCNSKTKIIKGDLYFKIIDLTSPEGISEEQAKKLEIIIDSSNSSKNKNLEDQSIIEYFKVIKKHNLLRSPYIKLKLGEKDFKTIFLNKKEYKKLKKYTLDYLSKNHTKLEVELKIQEIEKDIFYSDKIINLKEVIGKTYSNK
jgi:radical SAM superfamily enzyme YgiQ (UPF0313 family)